MQIVRTFGSLVGGILLVAGTSIGVGMLALPVATAEGGFIPSLTSYLACWLFMLCTGLLVLEACIWMPAESNLITLAHRLLGKGGRLFCWILYLYLFSCLMIAHISGGGEVVAQLAGNSLPDWLCIILYVALFSPAVYLGTRAVDRLNVMLISGVVITYLIFVLSSSKYVEFEKLTVMNWAKAPWALPVVFTAFGYQSLIPTLMTYLNRNVRKVRFSICVGTLLPFLIYIVWEAVILGIVPVEGPGGLVQALRSGHNAVTPLGNFLHKPWIMNVGNAFAFFALTTSYLGISIAFVDFLADGLKIKKTGQSKLALCGLIFLIPMAISLINPHLFILALSYAGGIGVALLLGAMPILMAWAGRYVYGYSSTHRQLFGGKWMLSLLMLFVVIELLIQIAY
jgi:tyrosine-specific transport protein